MFIEVDPSEFAIATDGSRRPSQIIAVLAPAIVDALQAAARLPQTRYWCDLGGDYALILVGTGSECRPCDRAGILLTYEEALDIVEVRSVDGWQDPFGEPIEIDVSIMIDFPEEFGIPADTVGALIGICADAVEYAERSGSEAAECELEDA